MTTESSTVQCRFFSPTDLFGAKETGASKLDRGCGKTHHSRIETWENTRIWSAFSHLSNHVTCSTNAQQFRTTMRLIQYLHCTVLDGWRGCSARLQRSYYLWRWIGEAESTEAADAPPWSSPGSSNFFKGRDPHKLPLSPTIPLKGGRHPRADHTVYHGKPAA
jgi:hypothetical protein